MKVKLFNCKWFEAEYDDLSKDYWCRNPDCPTRECWCELIAEQEVCPGFEKSSSKPQEMEYTKDQINHIRVEFIKKISKILNEDFDKTLRDCNSLIQKQMIIRNAIKKIQDLEKSTCVE